MPQRDYNRYEILINSNNTTDLMPFVELPLNTSDKYETWNTQYSRLDKLSQKYYGSPFYDFLILYANPDFVTEWDIPQGYVLRIPFPLQKVKADYENALTTYRLQND